MESSEIREYERDASIDALKGLTVFLVVLGHIVAREADFHMLYNLIYSFHMPLFMFLSGCTAVLSYRRRTGSDGAYLKRRFLNILVPYFAWAFLLPIMSAGTFHEVDWHSAIVKTFVTNRMFWFLPTLYGLLAAYICYRRIGNRFRDRLKQTGDNEKTAFLLDCLSCVIVVGIISALMLLTGYQLFRDIVGFTIPFFAAVMYMEHEWIRRLFYKRLSFLAALVIYVLLIGRFDFDRIAVTTSLLRMLLGMCAVVMLFHVFSKRQTANPLIRMSAFWGRYSLLTYILHAQVIGRARLLEVRFSGSVSNLLWYCLIGIAVCCVCSVFAVCLEHIPVVRLVLLGKRGDRYVRR